MVARGKTGVKARGVSIQIGFSWNGAFRRETLRLDPTPKNLKYAETLKAEIDRKIEIGTFNYGDYFPRSKYVKALGLSKPLTQISGFSDLADTWIKSNGHLATGTLNKYRQAINFWKSQLANEPVSQIKYSLLAAIAGSQDWKAKHRNNMLIPLRQVFEMARKDGMIKESPAEEINNSEVQIKPPDPFTLDEVNKILEYMKRYNEQILNYFELSFFTGMRPEEIIALQWGDIDWNEKLIRVERSRSASTDMSSTKTYVVRDVEMNSRAESALLRQKSHTFMKGEYIFENPNTGTRWNSEKFQRDLYWNPALKALGIRRRVPYKCRHTFATLNLMAGANPMWVANQLGHSNTNTLYKHYSKWIGGADKGREKSKLESLLNCTTNTQEKTN